VVAQCSSLGADDPAWVDEFTLSCASAGPGAELPQLCLVWPTVADVTDSVIGLAAGDSLFGDADAEHLKTCWYRWKSATDPLHRSRAPPHIKTYMQLVDKTGEEMAWMLLASHNLSRAAWGVSEEDGEVLFVRSFELGVFFTPTLLARHAEGGGFSLSAAAAPLYRAPVAAARPRLLPAAAVLEGRADAGSGYFLPIPYDIPPVPYSSHDEAWDSDAFPWPRDRFGANGTRTNLYNHLHTDSYIREWWRGGASSRKVDWKPRNPQWTTREWAVDTVRQIAAREADPGLYL